MNTNISTSHRGAGGATGRARPMGQRPWLRWILLGGLAASSFLITYALVTPLRRTPADRDGPPGMRWIPGGEFTMGTDSDLGWPDEKPAHRVRVGGFWMDQTEVTNAQFRR